MNLYDLNKPQAGFSPPTPGFDAQASIAAKPKKKGLFGQGGFGRSLAGAIGDALMQNAGMDPIYSRAVQSHRENIVKAQDEERKRLADLEDYAKKQEIEAQYRAPPAPNDTERDYQFWQERLTPQDFQKWLMNRVIDPPRFGMVNGMPAMIGGYQGPQSAPAAPQGPVGTLKPYGGQPSPAAGNFPR